MMANSLFGIAKLQILSKYYKATIPSSIACNLTQRLVCWPPPGSTPMSEFGHPNLKMQITNTLSQISKKPPQLIRDE